MIFNAFGSTPRGYQVIADLSEAVGLTPTVSGPAAFALLNPETKGVRWRDDGVAPTASVGMLIEAGEYFTYQGDLSALLLIQVEATAVLNVSYYSATGGLLKP